MAQAATPEQLLRWAPECFGELNLRTRARRDGYHWVIDGHKIWIGDGGIAKVHVVNATVDPGLGNAARRCSSSRAARPGWRWCASWTSSAAVLPTRRGCARTRCAYPRRTCSAARSASSARLADLASELGAARLLTWRAAWMSAQRIPFQRAEGSMSELRASEVAQRIVERAVQVCGGWGYITDLPVEKWYRDAKLYTIFEGTSEIQRVVVGRALAASAGEPPLHHRRRPRRSRSAAARRRVRARAWPAWSSPTAPRPVLKLAMNVLTPPRPAARKTKPSADATAPSADRGPGSSPP